MYCSYKRYLKKSVAVLLTVMMLAALPFATLFGCGGNNNNADGKKPGGITAEKYTGYDGYIWSGKTRTDKLDVTADAPEDDVLETTVGIESAPMNKYFSGDYVDLSDSKIALMSYYTERNGYSIPDDWQTPKQYTAYEIDVSGSTGYSSTILKKLTVYAESDGKLEIGTALLSDVYKAETQGRSLQANMTSYSISEGENVIDVNMFINGDSTVVLGGNDSVGLYYAAGIDNDDNQGDFQLLDGSVKSGKYSTTDGIKDKLAICSQISYVDSAIENVRTTYTDNISTYAGVVTGVAPFAYYNSSLLTGKTLAAIEIPVQSVDAINQNQVFTIRVTNRNNAITSGNFSGATTYSVKLPYEQIKGLNAASVNKWVTVDLSGYNIRVGAGQTVLFGSSDDNVKFAYCTCNFSKDQTFYMTPTAGSAMTANITDNQVNNENNPNLMFNVFTVNTENVADKIGYFKEDYELVKLLDGKTASLIGDSISTFNGVNNNGTYNSTIGGNAVYYLGKGSASRVVDKPGDTWWGRTVDRLGMKLCVNGAWSGSATVNETERVADEACRDAYRAAGCNTRPYELHRDGATRVDPDLIFVYMGTNDCIRNEYNGIDVGNANNINWNALETTDWDAYTVKSAYASAEWLQRDMEYRYYQNTVNLDFANAYAVMLYKMHKTYPNAKIYCLTVLHHGLWTTGGYHETENTITSHNAAIKLIAEHFGDTVVDLYNSLGGASYDAYNMSVGDWLHPNEEGHKLMSNCLVDAIRADFMGD